LNPKAILFLTSLLTAVVRHDMPTSLLVAFGTIIFFQTFIWYSIVAVFLSGKKIREKVSSIEHWINRVTGVILLVIGVRLLF
jgi:threonine/homoserine/homoserine lactone efflux protein